MERDQGENWMVRGRIMVEGREGDCREDRIVV